MIMMMFNDALKFDSIDCMMFNMMIMIKCVGDYSFLYKMILIDDEN